MRLREKEKSCLITTVWSALIVAKLIVLTIPMLISRKQVQKEELMKNAVFLTTP